MNRVIHFEIHADKPERAIKFYKEVFGWRFEKWGDQEYWMVMTAEKESKEPGINGGLLKRPVTNTAENVGANAFVCTVMVKSFDEMAMKIEKCGGKIAMPKMAIPQMAWQGYFLDPEGNVFGIHEPDVNAK